MKLRKYSVSTELISQIFITGSKIPHDPEHYSHVVITEGLPEGAEVIEAKWTNHPPMLKFLVMHDTFETVPEGMNAWSWLSSSELIIDVVAKEDAG